MKRLTQFFKKNPKIEQTDQELKEISSLDLLPKEISLHILSFLTLKELLLVRILSRTWNKQASDAINTHPEWKKKVQRHVFSPQTMTVQTYASLSEKIQNQQNSLLFKKNIPEIFKDALINGDFDIVVKLLIDKENAVLILSAS